MIWGMRDPVFTEAFLEEFERLLPNHQPSLRLENASHFLQDDEPEPIVRAMRAFMQSTSRSHSRAELTPATA
jgi:haloalkane dehalogenase